MTRRTASPVTPPPMKLQAVGAQLANGIVFGADTSARPLHWYFSRSGNGAVVILFSQACSGCVGEALEWQRMDSLYGRGIQFVGLTNEVTADYTQGIAAAAGVRFPLLRAETALLRALDAPALPTIYAVDTAGYVRFRAAGARATPQLRAWLESR